MMLDSSHHHGDFLSPPGGHSPDGRAVANARPTSETLAHAADVVSHEIPENPVVNGVQQGRGSPTQASLLSRYFFFSRYSMSLGASASIRFQAAERSCACSRA